MNIGLIVYSETGHTLSVAEKMLETLTAAGHTAEIRQITIQPRPKADSPVVLDQIPSPHGFDALIFGAPVQAFSLCRAMTLYLKQLPAIQGIPTAAFVTQALPKKWMGGNNAYRSIRKYCTARGSNPARIGHVHWKSDQRDEQIAEAVSGAAKFAATAG